MAQRATILTILTAKLNLKCNDPTSEWAAGAKHQLSGQQKKERKKMSMKDNVNVVVMVCKEYSWQTRKRAARGQAIRWRCHPCPAHSSWPSPPLFLIAGEQKKTFYILSSYIANTTHLCLYYTVLVALCRADDFGPGSSSSKVPRDHNVCEL